MFTIPSRYKFGTAVTNARFASLRGPPVSPVSLSTTARFVTQTARSSRAVQLKHSPGASVVRLAPPLRYFLRSFMQFATETLHFPSPTSPTEAFPLIANPSVGVPLLGSSQEGNS